MYQEMKYINGVIYYEEKDGKYYPIKPPIMSSVGGGGGINKNTVNNLIRQFLNNNIETKRVSHIITEEEIAAKVFSVSVVWDTPFADTNYTTTWSVNDLGVLPNGFNFIPVDMHNITANGFTANLFLGADTPSVQPGDEVIVNAIAIHD